MLSPVPAGPPESKRVSTSVPSTSLFFWVLSLSLSLSLSLLFHLGYLDIIRLLSYHILYVLKCICLKRCDQVASRSNGPAHRCDFVLNIPSPVEKPPPSTLKPVRHPHEYLCSSHLCASVVELQSNRFPNLSQYVLHTPQSLRERDRPSPPTERCPEDTR